MNLNEKGVTNLCETPVNQAIAFLFDYIYKRIGVIFTLQPLAKEPLTLAGDISQLSQPRDSTNTVVEENVYLICMKFDGIKRHQKQSLMGVVLCPIRAC